MSNNNDYQQMYDLCGKHMHSYVLAELNDGTRFNGVVTGVDENNVYLAVPGSGEQTDQRYDVPDDEDSRQYGGWRPRPRPYYHGGYYGYPSYGYGYGYPGYGYGYPGYGYYGPGRFGRLVLPLAGLTALSLLPWY